MSPQGDPVFDEVFCQKVVVRNAPCPDKFSGKTEQTLDELGVVDSDQAAIHKSKIQADLRANGFAIKQDDIKSGVGVSVYDCGDSVLCHAQ
jgi:hypothetical protein